jgi:hypothetical protein
MDPSHSDEGQLMTWGSNGLRLGLDNSTGTAAPTVVSGLEGCVLLSCSATQTAVLGNTPYFFI